MRPLPIPADDHRPEIEDHQLLCNAVDGKMFRLPLVPGDNSNKFYRMVDPEYLKTVDPKKVIAFAYETGSVGFVDLFDQIRAAHLSTQEIINVVTTADKEGPFSTDAIYEVKYDLERTMSENTELMEWLENHPSKPPEGWPEVEPKAPTLG